MACDFALTFFDSLCWQLHDTCKGRRLSTVIARVAPSYAFASFYLAYINLVKVLTTNLVSIFRILGIDNSIIWESLTAPSYDVEKNVLQVTVLHHSVLLEQSMFDGFLNVLYYCFSININFFTFSVIVCVWGGGGVGVRDEEWRVPLLIYVQRNIAMFSLYGILGWLYKWWCISFG